MILLFLETTGEKKDEINRGLITEGERLSQCLNLPLAAVTIGDREEYPLPLYRIEGKGLEEYSGEAYAWAMKEARIPFTLLLFAHTERGSELAPRVAFFLDTVAVSDCVDITVRENTLFYRRFPYGGQFSEEVSYLTPLPQVATIRPEVLNIRITGGSGTPSLTPITVDVPPDLPRTRVLDRIPPDYRTVDILYAKRIIGAGSGSTDLLPLIEELSHLLQGSIGTTRPVVDDGFLPRDRMIGQTGKTVSPDLYMALGISGSPHHVAGITNAKTILSVNKDPKAPIFTVSDKGFAGDLSIILPRLITLITQLRDEA